MRKKIWIIAVGCLTISSSSWASGPGTTAADVLSVGVGARAIAMGEAFTAMADDVSSVYWNPAGLALLNQSAASFMYNQAYQDMTFNNGSLGVSLENGGLAGSLSYLGYGNIDGFDESGNPSGSVNAYNGVATLGGGLLMDAWSFGVNAKAVQGQLADEKATGFAADLGTNFVYPEAIMGGSTLRFGASLRNLGTGMKYLEQNDPFPTEWRVGTSLLQLGGKKLNISLDYGQARGIKGSVYAGSEYWMNPFIALRAGYSGNHSESNGLRAGIGLKIKDISFDYAFASYGDLGLTHRYELTYRFGEIRPRLTPEERRLYKQAKRDIRNERYGSAVLVMDSLMKMEPKYKPFSRTYKAAIKGNEQQERLAQGQKTFNLNVPHNAKAGGSLPEMDELDALLAIAERAENQQNAMVPSPQGVKQ